jgi:hypothetical protein
MGCLFVEQDAEIEAADYVREEFLDEKFLAYFLQATGKNLHLQPKIHRVQEKNKETCPDAADKLSRQFCDRE